MYGLKQKACKGVGAMILLRNMGSHMTLVVVKLVKGGEILDTF